MIVHTATPGPFPEFDSSVKVARLAQANAVAPPGEPLPPPRKERSADKGAKQSPPSKAAEAVRVALPPVPGRIILDAGEPAAPAPRPAPPPPPPSGPVPGTVIFEESR
jgi:hypothetical protein